MNKQQLRTRIRARKQAMTEAEIVCCSQHLAAQLRSHPLYRNATAIYGYVSYNQEVRTLPILRRALADGKRVAVPRVEGTEIRFYWLESPDALTAGYRGIPEPAQSCPAADDPAALVLMPGLAFDRHGGRLGYGGGFYDRFLAREPGHPTLALCYGFQMVEQIEQEAFDIPVDCVLRADAQEEKTI